MKEKKAQVILEEIKKTYDAISDEFSATRSRPENEFSFTSKYLNPEMKILDLGCGNGRLLAFLEKITDIKTLREKYIGMDTSKNLLTLAGRLHPGYKFSQGDQLNIPTPENNFDIIFNIRAFHHIPSSILRRRALDEMKKKLKKDGILIISVWNLWQKKYIKTLLYAFFRFIFTLGAYDYNDTLIPWGKKARRYYHAFTLRELKKYITAAGFRIIEAAGLNHDFVIIARK